MKHDFDGNRTPETVDFFPSISGLWLKSAAVQMIVALIGSWWLPLGVTSAVTVWLCAMVLFVWMARYDWSECKNLVRTFLPGSSRNATDNGVESLSGPVHPPVAALH